MTFTRSRGIPITIERTRRTKTASFQVHNGRVRVLVPRHLSEREISALIDGKMDWIVRTREIQAGLAPPVEHDYVTGESFTFLGDTCTLEVIREAERFVELDGPRLVVSVGDRGRPGRVRNQLVDWYRAQALDHLRERTREFALAMRLPEPAIRVREYRARWGSCMSDGRIVYNWKIVIAPPRVIDYVVVHELCHLVEQNHSPAYWRLVARAMPDYRNRKRWLREHGQTLDV